MLLSPIDESVVASQEAPYLFQQVGRKARKPISGAMAKLISGVDEALGSASNEADALCQVPALLAAQLDDSQLLTAPQRCFDTVSYKRHLVHADPNGRFSILALAWLPGQITPVHGHNAWGVVGVHLGTIENTCYNVDTNNDYTPGDKHVCRVGDVAGFAVGDCSAHRLFNPGPEAAYTIHIYGMDLASEPTGINRYYD